MGSDDFLGQTSLSLSDFDVYEKPKTRYQLMVVNHIILVKQLTIHHFNCLPAASLHINKFV